MSNKIVDKQQFSVNMIYFATKIRKQEMIRSLALTKGLWLFY